MHKNFGKVIHKTIFSSILFCVKIIVKYYIVYIRRIHSDSISRRKTICFSVKKLHSKLPKDSPRINQFHYIHAKHKNPLRHYTLPPKPRISMLAQHRVRDRTLVYSATRWLRATSEINELITLANSRTSPYVCVSIRQFALHNVPSARARKSEEFLSRKLCIT